MYDEGTKYSKERNLNMKNKTRIIFIIVAIICILLCGCSSESQTERMPDLGIDWNTIVGNISSDELAEYGWFAEMESLLSDAQELGTIMFCNYDPAEADAFKSVDYQFTIEYGIGAEYTDGAVDYYDTPVYSIFLTDNASDNYYACTYNEDFDLLAEEGGWFLDQDRDEYVFTCLESCREIIFES